MEKYTLSKSANGQYIATDNEHGIKVYFEKHRFNETQKCEYSGTADFMILARYMRELGDWLNTYHKDIVF